MPAFLQGITGHIFDRETGRLYDEVPPIFVEAARQICLVFKKVEIPCTPAREYAALENFAQTERDFQSFSIPDGHRSSFERVSNALWPSVLANLRLDAMVPRHGPGATAEGVSGNRKYLWSTWYERLEPYFPFIGNAYCVTEDSESLAQHVKFVPVDQELPVRVVLVPKTLKSPRVIAIEPVCMQFVQQGIRDALYTSLESNRLTKGHVNFTDQSINQGLALTSSRDGRLATIDLSDASDRVPHDLAMTMFNSNPDLRDAIDACRSTSAELPDGRVISPLRKFASMGSALCFPVEAMYFYTSCVVALLEVHNLPCTTANVFKVSRSVYVYGDDIIVNADDADSVLACLQRYNCKVNSNKTFVTGKFRESCGLDAYDGVPVTPVYLRHLRPKNRQSATELVSWIATANSFFQKGYWRVASFMWCTCEAILGPLPYVSKESSALGRVTFLGYRSASRWNRDYQALELKAWVPSPVYRSDSVDGYSALQKCLLSLESRPHFTNVVESVRVVDASHLERSALRGAVTLKRRWVPIRL